MDNTLWANTAVASGSALGLVVYTGQETRSLMNHSEIRSKVGLLDQEINQLTKVCVRDVTIICNIKRYMYEYTNINLDYISIGTILCSNRTRPCNDVSERIQRTLVSLHVPFCFAIFLHHTDQFESKSRYGQGVLRMVHTKR